MGQAKNRGSREQRVALAEQRETAARVGAALASARQAEARAQAERNRAALAQAARDDSHKPPPRHAVIGGVSPRMRLALAGLALAVDSVGTVTNQAAPAQPESPQ